MRLFVWYLCMEECSVASDDVYNYPGLYARKCLYITRREAKTNKHTNA